MSSSTHYEDIASSYNQTWAYSPEYVADMSSSIVSTLELVPTDVVVDLGGGTGLYSAEMAKRVHFGSPVYCVDPSPSMLSQLPIGAAVSPVLGSAEELISGGLVRAGVPTRVDAILVRAAIHHVEDQKAVLVGLSHMLNPGGRVLVVMCPRRLDYALFAAALDRYEEHQPEASEIAVAMRSAGLTTEVTEFRHRLTFTVDRYCEMVRNRYMSILSTFSDKEIEAGIDEIRDRHPGKHLSYDDVFVFTRGRKPVA